MFMLTVLAVVACLGGWIYGEVCSNRSVRILSTLASVLVFSAVSATVACLHTSLSVGVPMSTAVHEYLDASRVQLANGNTQFVVDEFSGFKQRATVTYESGAFRADVERETQRMLKGPNTP